MSLRAGEGLGEPFSVNAETTLQASSTDKHNGTRLGDLPNGEFIKQVKRGQDLELHEYTASGEVWNVMYEIRGYSEKNNTLLLGRTSIRGPYVPAAEE